MTESALDTTELEPQVHSFLPQISNGKPERLDRILAAAHGIYVADSTVVYQHFTVDKADSHRIVKEKFPELKALSTLLGVHLAFVSLLQPSLLTARPFLAHQS